MTLNKQLSIFEENNKKKILVTLSIDQCQLSQFNPRITRQESDIHKLAERIQRNGFEITRALWVYPVNGHYEVFAGGTRFLAAQQANLDAVPVVLHQGFTEEEIVKLADDDNENDEYHASVPITDVWAECWRLNKAQGWTQEKISDIKGISRQLVVNRVKWHEFLPESVKNKVSDGVFDEGHIEAISGVVSDVGHLQSWLTSEQAQIEFVDDILEKHRGSSAGIKPTVKNVREKAKEWKEMIQQAESLYDGFDAVWQPRFVDALISLKARTKAAVMKAYAKVLSDKNAAAKAAEEAAKRAQTASEEAARKAAEECRKQEEIQMTLAKIVCGDAVQCVAACPDNIKLVLTDPPYGNDPQSQRAVVSSKAASLANDSDAIFEIVSSVLTQLFPKMANDSAVLLWTGWEFEPRFRDVVTQAGFTLKNSLIWVKPNHGAGDLAGGFAPKHERLLFAVKGKPTLSRRLPDVFEGKEFLTRGDHPNKKPVDALQSLITSLTDEGDLIVDPFMGSGSTVLTAYRMKRDFWGCDIEDRYFHSVEHELLSLVEQEGK